MLLAPAGWAKVELNLTATPEGLRVTELQTHGTGTKAPKARPMLNIDLKEEALRLSEGLTELASQLKNRWQPGRVIVERSSAGFADWKLTRDDGSVAWFTRIEQTELMTLLITDELFDALVGTERAFHDLQGQLQQRLGTVSGFAFDATHGMLRLDRPGGALELQAQVVGSYFPDVFTWVWSWGDPSALEGSVGRVRKVCQPELKPDGLAAFWRPHFHCDEGFAWALAGNVAVSIGARGLFRAQSADGDGALVFALLELPSQVQ